MRQKYYNHITVDASGGFVQSTPESDENLTKNNIYDAGLDIKSRETVRIDPGQRALVSTGLYLEILPGYAGMIWARSGLAVKHGIMVGAGLVDSTYRGEVKVLLFNMGDKTFVVRKGDRIAQLVTVPINIGLYIPVPYLSSTKRGEDGFGSSGK